MSERDQWSVGTRVLVRTDRKVDKKYRGLTGTVIDHGLPVSKFDHLVHLDQMRENRWFALWEMEVLHANSPD